LADITAHQVISYLGIFPLYYYSIISTSKKPVL
jgi:hypothetical protein